MRPLALNWAASLLIVAEIVGATKSTSMSASATAVVLRSAAVYTATLTVVLLPARSVTVCRRS